MKFETNLHLARGLGPAKSGLHHWMIQRVTAVALIPLSLWFVYTFIILVSAPYEYAREWLSSPWTATSSIFLIFLMFYHGCLGMQTIVEDYISQTIMRWALIIGINFFSAIMAILATVSILKVFLS
jgi:succinate dehydrogenase / fumarate reductase membrane anchor subunit